MGAGPLEEVDPLIDPDRPPQPIRAFFALPLPDAQRQALSGHLSECAARAPSFRWVSADNLHLTMRFLGRVDRDVALRVGRRLAAHVLPAPRLELSGLGTFKRGRLVRVVWAGLRSGADAAAALAAVVESECAAAGIESEARPFAPHLTLARARERDGAALPDLPPMPGLEPWTAKELVLFQSHLSPRGARYEPLAGVRLGASD